VIGDDAQVPCRAATRADAQRDRILCAALRCFIHHGFHAASMASIAETAQMSAGLIYRYFESKNAIVLAIVERQLKEKGAMIRQLQSTHQLVDNLVQAYDHWTSGRDDTMSIALMLEMTAEATRNPQIAETLRRADEFVLAQFEDWLSRDREQGGAGLPRAVASKRAVSIRFVIEGLVLRAAREPDLDRAVLRAALDDTLQPLLR
jgi:AcrR family transcriptional regulator